MRRWRPIEIAVAADHPYSIAMAYFGAGRWRAIRGDFLGAIPWLERAFNACRQQGFYALSVIGAWAGLAYAHCGRAADGITLLEESLAHEEALKFMPDRARTLTLLGEVYLLANRPEEALRAGDRALAVSRAIGQQQFEVMALRLLGDVHAQRDPSNVDPEQMFRHALALAEPLGLRPESARCRLALGGLYRRAGRRTDALRELVRAHDMLRSMRMVFWLKDVEAQLDSL